MPITVQERHRSREGEFGSSNYAEIKYIASGSDTTADESTEIEAVRVAVAAVAPGEYNTLPIVSIAPVEIVPGTWEVTARYRTDSGGGDMAVGESRYSFDIGTSQVHATHSIATVSRKVIGNAFAIDYNGAVGVTDDSVEGYDYDVSTYEWEERHIFAAGNVTNAYRGNLMWLARVKNNAEFRGCAAGECRLRGVRGGQRSDGTWDLTFRFAAIPNASVTNPIAVGPAISVTNKKGWDHLWVTFKNTIYASGSNQVMVKSPYQANVEQIYYDGDYAGLEIGTGPYPDAP